MATQEAQAEEVTAQTLLVISYTLRRRKACTAARKSSRFSSKTMCAACLPLSAPRSATSSGPQAGKATEEEPFLQDFDQLFAAVF